MSDLEIHLKDFLNLLFVTFIALTTSNAIADWEVEKHTNFKGETETYLVSKSNDGSEIWIDPQMNQIAYAHQKKVIKNINGIKIDGKYFDSGNDATGDNLDRVAFCSQARDPECYKRIFNAQTVEVNVNYFGDYSKVSTFRINASSDTLAKFYIDPSIEKCKKSKNDYYLAAYDDLIHYGRIFNLVKSDVTRFCEHSDTIEFFHVQDSKLYSDVCGLYLDRFSRLSKSEGLAGLLGCALTHQCESLELKNTKDYVKQICNKVDWSLNPENSSQYQDFLEQVK